ncbi:Alpha/beta hydrolase fold [Pseudomonas mandelii JR-1]|uniref:Alpha/beta hydrolase fold n=1 Tax=Pseudomonas mandelii JR-1 TaxID=1147786 RepID=A0A024E716_9PSED|nr:Alpha/beta hydrolase fold [Pseudomonas mandelii JR-1]
MATSHAGFVLHCHLHGDVSVARRWPGVLAEPLETLKTFERGDVSGLCRNSGPVKTHVSRG